MVDLEDTGWMMDGKDQWVDLMWDMLQIYHPQQELFPDDPSDHKSQWVWVWQVEEEEWVWADQQSVITLPHLSIIAECPLPLPTSMLISHLPVHLFIDHQVRELNMGNMEGGYRYRMIDLVMNVIISLRGVGGWVMGCYLDLRGRRWGREVERIWGGKYRIRGGREGGGILLVVRGEG
jgi:hypothetical protein